ncbi:hypothetical protein ABIC28_004324 [Rhodococcus sp. PvR044]|uniref:DUF3558 domain-containing protein n=1 Tax=unclassified Rhodococcus (in: high G+C Gram-positive bacteria) TaxID=192944 RepID=UPI000BD00E5C|nr:MULTISPECIES: DUF3558 domain-containing protein [unclassified Rhodococcus (in: high G+C Gram-positive bacteria)]PTR36716.1 uncharacterized protein DUF3558 [Rhodococcus sp. OK611]SNX93810.1 Protein of unknown function [Rhodococcus sp. OK270]
MRLHLRGLAGFGLVCGALVLVGCGSESVAGEAEAVGAGAGEPVFSPCDDIPDEVLLAVGMDPATESKDILGVKQPGWNICRWAGLGTGPSLTVFATDRSMDDIRSNTRNTDFEAQTIGDREAFSYREVSDGRRENCDVAVSSGDGSVLVRISLNTGVQPVEGPCQTAVTTARQLEPAIPR